MDLEERKDCNANTEKPQEEVPYILLRLAKNKVFKDQHDTNVHHTK